MSDFASELIRSAALWFEPEMDGLGAVVDRLGDARLVLIGESTHGTQEFYRVRAELTRALITQKGFNIVAVEADWPDAYRANRYVRGASADRSAAEALDDFKGFPRWMWRNHEVVRFVEWLGGHNAARAEHEHAGFYGLDLYSLHTSMDAALTYLRSVDPAAAERALARYRCLEGFGEDAQSHRFAASLGLTRSCEDEVVAQLIDLRQKAAEYVSRHGAIGADEHFMAEQNARLVKNAERYYRAMFGGRQQSWNLRDTHMMETLDALLSHVGGTGSTPARAVVWAHNSHLGDARATEMGQHGEINLGQLARERYQREVRLIGFTTFAGSVTAASDWDEPPQNVKMLPALPASYEALLHTAGLERFMLSFENEALCAALTTSRLERAIGVTYRPDTERLSHYFTAQLCKQFDIVLHIDRTRALEPLETWSQMEPDPAETFRSGLWRKRGLTPFPAFEF
jgi:erythromycin esterase-like protein